MQISGGHIIYLHYQESPMLACFLINSLVNYGYYFFKAKINSLTLSSFSYPGLKYVGKNSDACKQMVGKNLLVLYSKTFTIKKASPLAMWHLIYINKRDSVTILEDTGYNKRLTTIDDSLLVNFWAKTIDITNYLYNQLLKKRDGSTFIPKKTWTKTR